MILRSDVSFSPRNRRHGAILLETLIAFALIGAFAIVALQTLSSSATSQTDRAQSYWLAEFARSKAEEFAVTGAQLPASGVANEDWLWSASEKRVWPDGKSRFDADIALYEITIEVASKKRPKATAQFKTVLARAP